MVCSRPSEVNIVVTVVVFWLSEEDEDEPDEDFEEELEDELEEALELVVLLAEANDVAAEAVDVTDELVDTNCPEESKLSDSVNV